MSAECRFFHFIGSYNCDNCGRLAKEHDGHRVLKVEAGPFGHGEGDWENLTWEQWDERLAQHNAAREARAKIAALPDSVVVGFVAGLASVGETSNEKE